MYDRVSGRIRVSLVQSGQPAQISHNAVFFQFPVQQRWEKILKKNKRSRSYETWEYVDFFAKIYHEFCYISLENLTTHITFMPKTNFFLCIGDLIPSLCSRSVILILANWSPWFTSFFKSVLYIPRPKLSIHTQSTSRDQSENGFLLKVWALLVDQPSRPPAVARNPPRRKVWFPLSSTMEIFDVCCCCWCCGDVWTLLPFSCKCPPELLLLIFPKIFLKLCLGVLGSAWSPP